jgi:hypothetical protein
MALYKVKVTGEIEAEANSEEHAISAAIMIPTGTRNLRLK